MATAYPGGLRKRGGLLDNEDTIQATPRNAFFGGVADLLGQAYKLPEMPRMGVPGLDFVAANRNRLMDLLGVGDVQKTAEAMAYGNRLGTGRGMTYQPLPETVGAALTVAPMVAPAARMVGKGAVETGRFVAPKAGQLAEQYMVNTGGILPLDVYHGTPHKFSPTERNPLGEFDASKIGTGEGAQAYGHGIYMAENPSVAQQYQRNVSRSQYVAGQSDESDKIAGKPIEQFYEALQRKADKLPVQQAGIEYEKLAFLENLMQQPSFDAAVKRIENEAIVPWAKALKSQYQPAGQLYKVDLPDEKIAQMLDWDKPLSQQSENVQQALAQLGYVSDKNKIGQFDDALLAALQGGSIDLPKQPLNLTGEAIYRKLGSPQIASEKLKQLGIPGVQYLDAGSRNAAKGTRNFVVFPGEEKSMTILERNAQKAEELKRLQAGGLLAP